MKYHKEIMDIVKKTIKLTEPIENIAIDESLQNLGVDSLSFVRVIVGIEERFKVEIPDDALVITQDISIANLCELIMKVVDDRDRIKMQGDSRTLKL